MTLLRFLCAFTLFFNHNMIKADENPTSTNEVIEISEQDTHLAKEQAPEPLYNSTQFEHIELLIETLKNDLLQKTSTIKNFNFFQHQQNEIDKLQKTLENTYHKAIKIIEDEKFNAEKQYQQRISQAQSDTANELKQADTNYKNLYIAHSTKLQKLTIDEQALAIEKFKATAVVELHEKKIVLQEKHAKKLEQLADEHMHELKFIIIKKQAIQEKYACTINHYYAMLSIFDREEEKALIKAQIEHLQQLEQRDFDETYTTATHPTIWSGLSSIMGSSPYTYRANEHGLECAGCIELQNSLMNNHLKKEMEDAQSPQAAQSLAMVIWALKKSQAKEGQDHTIGIQTCRIDGNNIHCTTIQDAYKKLLEEHKKASEIQEAQESEEA